MVKKLITILSIILAGSAVFANPQNDVEAFFNRYVAAANNYSQNLPSFYAPNAKIIRVIIQKNGKKESVVTDTRVYMEQLKIGASVAKVRNYKNFYTDRVISKVGNDYKISCMRKPSLSDYKLPAYFVIGKDSRGQYKIKEESMDTYQTIILTKAKEKQNKK